MASPRERAASMATARFSFTFFCPINSARRCGRSFNSKEESSPTGAAETRRSRLGSGAGLFFTEATVPDGRTKCESTQLQDRGVRLRVYLMGLRLAFIPGTSPRGEPQSRFLAMLSERRRDPIHDSDRG